MKRDANICSTTEAWLSRPGYIRSTSTSISVSTQNGLAQQGRGWFTEGIVKTDVKQSFLRIALRVVLGLLLSGSLLFASALAVDRELHQCVHHDADQEGHQCLAVTLSNGHVELTGGAVALVLLVLSLLCLAAPVRIFFAPSVSHRLPPGRAPPVRFA
jgi:hypothetical protein